MESALQQLSLEEQLLWGLAATLGLSLLLLFIGWAVERFAFQSKPPPCKGQRKTGWRFFGETLLLAIPISAIAVVLCNACESAADALGWDLPEQDLVLLLKSGALPARIVSILAAFAVIEAPLMEEAIFRRYIFRNLLRLRNVRPSLSMVTSGFLFALVHVNAVSFIPLWFFGIALAWLYYRTGRLLAPMLTHFLFNLVSVATLLLTTEQ